MDWLVFKEYQKRLMDIDECYVFQHLLTEANINKFKRSNPKRYDCVINMMQIMGMMNNTSAKIMRILVDKHNGVQMDQIEEIFNTLLPGRKYYYRHFAVKNYEDNIKIKYIIDNIKLSHCLFSGIYYKDGKSGHAFIIARTNQDQIVVIDPQLDGFIESHIYLNDLLNNKSMYFFALFSCPT